MVTDRLKPFRTKPDFSGLFFSSAFVISNGSIDILDCNNDFSMALPKTCSFRDKDVDCPLPPAYIISVADNGEEYMIAVVCQDHRDQMEKWLKAMQSVRKIPQGKAKFQEIKLIVTDCIRDTDLTLFDSD
jgi:hypothetical protein